MEIVQALAGLVILIFAGDLLVRGAVALSLRLGVPTMVVGLTIVAFGTSLPELLVSIDATLSGAPAIALGNVVGSNITNVLLVLGVPAVMATVPPSGPGTSRNFAIMLAASVLLILLQILFLLERNTISGLQERIARLKKYANRQFRKDEYFRPVQFIRLLQQLSKAEFQVEELSNTEKYLTALQSHPFFYRGIASELEVIPYEKLWERILSYLK